MDKKIQIRNLHSKKKVPPRVFDGIKENGKVYIEIKNGKNDVQRIPWDDITYQMKDLTETS